MQISSRFQMRRRMVRSLWLTRNRKNLPSSECLLRVVEDPMEMARNRKVVMRCSILGTVCKELRWIWLQPKPQTQWGEPLTVRCRLCPNCQIARIWSKWLTIKKLRNLMAPKFSFCLNIAQMGRFLIWLSKSASSVSRVSPTKQSCIKFCKILQMVWDVCMTGQSRTGTSR